METTVYHTITSYLPQVHDLLTCSILTSTAEAEEAAAERAVGVDAVGAVVLGRVACCRDLERDQDQGQPHLVTQPVSLRPLISMRSESRETRTLHIQPQTTCCIVLKELRIQLWQGFHMYFHTTVKSIQKSPT